MLRADAEQRKVRHQKKKLVGSNGLEKLGSRQLGKLTRVVVLNDWRRLRRLGSLERKLISLSIKLQ